MNSISSIKQFLLIIACISGGFFLLAILGQVNVISSIFGNNEAGNLLNFFGEAVLGFMSLLFIAMFVTFILLSQKLNRLLDRKPDDETKKKEPFTFIKLLKIIVVVNAFIAFAWFGIVKAEVEGDPSFDGEQYAVYYRGDFVKSITHEQYIEYTIKTANVTVFIFSSVFLLFSGMLFLNSFEEFKDLTISDKEILNNKIDKIR